MDDPFGINRYHKSLDSEFEKLCVEPCATTPQVGDRVLIAVGLLGMGHLWIREEAIVFECANTAYRVRFAHREDYETKQTLEMWVHQSLVTDVIGGEKQ